MLNDSIVGLVINDGEKDKLYQICIEYSIPILYPSLFKDDKNHHLWAFSKRGIGLAGTCIMMNLDLVLHGIDELRMYLNS